MTRLTLVPAAPERRDSIGRRIGRNWWREFNCDVLWNADQQWQREREQVAIGYDTEEEEFRQLRPRPTLKSLLIANRTRQHGVIH